MKMLNDLCKLLSCLCVGFFVTSAPLVAQTAVKLKEVMQAPDHYYDQQIKIKGKVLEVNKEENSSGGTYLLRDSDDTEVTIESKILPIIGKKYKVTLEVLKGEDSSTVRLQEVSRADYNKWKFLVYGLAGVALFFTAALVMGGTGDPKNPGQGG